MPGTVTVACKLPNGLHLDKIDKAGNRERVVTLRGPSQPFGLNSPDILHAAGLTHGVDADFFEAWMKEHVDYAPVKAGLIYAHTKPGEVIAWARDHVEQRTFYEPAGHKDLPVINGKRLEVVPDMNVR